MKRPAINQEREDRIIMEVVVDAYNETERAMGWYYYAEANLRFPFKARCTHELATSPLEAGEIVEVIEMADEEDCEDELMVVIEWDEEDLVVPLAQLKPSRPTALTRQVVDDWKYWLDRGYQF